MEVDEVLHRRPALPGSINCACSICRWRGGAGMGRDDWVQRGEALTPT